MAQIVRDARSAVVVRTGYSVTVKTPGRTYLFSEGGFSPRGFAAAAAVKKDAMAGASVDMDTGEVVDWNGIPGCNASAPRYYSVPVDTMLPANAVCVDIKAAYPSTLANLGIITGPTHDRLMRLTKPDRLKAVGMLGTTRHIQTFERARLVDMATEQEPTASAFFATCKHVGDVMAECAELSERAFLLFWVDGIFVRPQVAEEVRRTLDRYGFEHTTEPVEQIRRSAGGRFIFYRKSGKQTYLCVPRRIEFDATELIKTLGEC